MATTSASNANITNNVHLQMDMLEHAAPHIVSSRFAKQVTMPKNKRTTLTWRRAVTYSPADTPLVEGVTPTATRLTYESESATLQQYGDVTIVTDLATDTAENPVVKDATMMSGENIGRTLESLLNGTIKAGTGVSYANGSARTDVNTAISLNMIRNVVKTLERNKAKTISRVVPPGQAFNSFAIAPSYIGICHTDLTPDLENIPGFVPCEEYASRKLVHDNEIGKIGKVRFVGTADLDPWTDAGGAKGTMVSTTGTSADVYPVLIFGQEAFATVDLEGFGAIDPSVIPAGQKTKDDPLGQRGYVGWKTYNANTILNDAWIQRLEVAVSDIS